MLRLQFGTSSVVLHDVGRRDVAGAGIAGIPEPLARLPGAGGEANRLSRIDVDAPADGRVVDLRAVIAGCDGTCERMSFGTHLRACGGAACVPRACGHADDG